MLIKQETIGFFVWLLLFCLFKDQSREYLDSVKATTNERSLIGKNGKQVTIHWSRVECASGSTEDTDVSLSLPRNLSPCFSGKCNLISCCSDRV